MMQGSTIYGLPSSFRILGSGYLFKIAVPIWIMLAMLISGSLFLTRTRFGQEVYAIGSNPVAARFSGIPVAFRRMILYVVCGAIVGLAGVEYLARVDSAEAGMGESLLLPAIAAVVVGGTSLFGGVGGILGTLTGAVLLTLMINGLNLLKVASNWHPLVTGVVIFLAVLFDAVAHRERR
jgi:ribose transport system permease protein